MKINRPSNLNGDFNRVCSQSKPMAKNTGENPALQAYFRIVPITSGPPGGGDRTGSNQSGQEHYSSW